MYIRPQSAFRLLQNIPFDTDYNHTRLFSNVAEQEAYMSSKVMPNGSFIEFTYIRETNSVKIPANADNFKNANYCMFKNSPFSNRWYYGFVTNVEYVNNETAEVFFELDYFQSWFLDCTVEACYVEREHVADDTVGIHTVAENIDIGENVPMLASDVTFGDGTTDYFSQDNTWCVKYTVQPGLIDSLRGEWGTALQGNQLVTNDAYFDLSKDWYPNEDDPNRVPYIEHINDILNAQNELGNVVTKMQMFPKFFMTRGVFNINPSDHSISRPTFYTFGGWGSYTPKNNKCFTYPYTYLKVSNNQGDEFDYKWENFNRDQDGNIITTFYLYHYVGNGASCELRPSAYESAHNRTAFVSIEQFPQVSFEQNTSIHEGILATARALTQVASSGYISFTGGSKEYSDDKTDKFVHKTTNKRAKQKQYTNTVRHTIDETEDRSSMNYSITPLGMHKLIADSIGTLTLPSKTTTNANQSNLNIRWNDYGFTFYRMGIKPEYAKIVDHYFTRYGYKVNEYKIPELHSRLNFNYVKTVDCLITGNIPNEAHDFISSLFDRGITLWHNDDFGNYEENPII